MKGKMGETILEYQIWQWTTPEVSASMWKYYVNTGCELWEILPNLPVWVYEKPW